MLLDVEDLVFGLALAPALKILLERGFFLLKRVLALLEALEDFPAEPRDLRPESALAELLGLFVGALCLNSPFPLVRIVLEPLLDRNRPPARPPGDLLRRRVDLRSVELFLLLRGLFALFLFSDHSLHRRARLAMLARGEEVRVVRAAN